MERGLWLRSGVGLQQTQEQIKMIRKTIVLTSSKSWSGPLLLSLNWTQLNSWARLSDPAWAQVNSRSWANGAIFTGTWVSGSAFKRAWPITSGGVAND